jgi:site-specific DNA-methyltransferase (adenine-specific)
VLVQKFRLNEIIQADARELTKYVEPNSVALTITSPPYRNAIDYSQHVNNMKNSSNVWMRGTGKQTTAAYLDTMQEIFEQVFQVTKEGGFCCIVIGDEVVNGKLIPLPSLLLSRLVNLENEDDPNKWRLRDMIIWHKVTSGRNGAGNRFGLFVQFPYPSYFRANIMHENILILQKGKNREDISKEEENQIPLNRIVKREWANSIWNMPPVPPGSIKHPVPFPEQIPWRLITLLTQKGDVVLDPMNGSGQTTKVANNMGRNYLGFDIRKEYVTEAKKRVKQKLKIGDYLIPVYPKESWSNNLQEGFFETTFVDLSSYIPNGYQFLFKTESDKSIRGKKGVYVYYQNKKLNHLCFILGTNGKHSRLNLGTLSDSESMLCNVLIHLPSKQFIKAELNNLLETRIVENRQPVKACIDVLQNLGYVQLGEKIGQKQFYEITTEGKAIQKKIKQNNKK